MKKQRFLVSVTAIMLAVMLLLTACTSGQTSHVRIDDPNSSSRQENDSSSRPSGKEDAKNESEAKKVVQLIDSIGTVSLSSETAINRARTAYDALSDAAKALVTNYQTLVTAETKLAELKAEADTAAMQTEVDSVIALIDAIYPMSIYSGSAITEARTAYDALSEEAKALVTNYQTLVDAETVFPFYVEADPVITMINTIGTVTLDSASLIQAARTAYDALSSEAKALVYNYQTLTDAEAELEALQESSAASAAADAAFTITGFEWGLEDDGYYIFLEYTNLSNKTITDLKIEVAFTDEQQNPIIMDGFTTGHLILSDGADLAPGQTSPEDNYWGPVNTSQDPEWVFIYSVEIFYTDGTSLLIDGDAIYAICDW